MIEELSADLVLPGQLGDRFSSGEHLDGQVSPLLRRQMLGWTRNMNSCRSWPVKRSRSGSGITLRDRDRQSSLTIHVCFLRETVLVGTNHPNMEETGSLENPIPSGKCYLDLNRAEKCRETRSSIGRKRSEPAAHPCRGPGGQAGAWHGGSPWFKGTRSRGHPLCGTNVSLYKNHFH